MPSLPLSSPLIAEGTSPEVIAAIVGALAAFLLGLFSSHLAVLVNVFLFGPRLRLTVDTSPPDFDSQSFLYVRVCVGNAGARVATGCRCYLVRIEEWNPVLRLWQPTEYRDSFGLIWAYDDALDTCDIPQGARRHVDVVQYVKGVNKYIPRLKQPKAARPQPEDKKGEQPLELHPTEYATLFGKKGLFRFSVLVSANEVAPAVIEIDIAYDGTWPPGIDAANQVRPRGFYTFFSQGFSVFRQQLW